VYINPSSVRGGGDGGGGGGGGGDSGGGGPFLKFCKNSTIRHKNAHILLISSSDN
jgi:hypothetical protein